jgi:[ribosomal protein S5]-alanine N-acetyltransferase
VVETDAEAVLDLLVATKEFLAPYEPDRGEGFYTIEHQRARIAEGGRHSWLILDDGTPAGVVGLSDIARGALQRAVLSYWVDRARNGRGLCTQAVAAVIEIAFGELGLHRIEAGTLPDNFASQRVLEKSGFERFGLARRMLLIGGEWRDHVLFERIAD